MEVEEEKENWGRGGKKDEKRLGRCRGGGAGKAGIHVYLNIRYIGKQLQILDN